MPEANMPTERSMHVLYAVVMHQAAAKGDLTEMKTLAAQAEQHLAQHGDVSAALEALKMEIAKLEARSP